MNIESISIWYWLIPILTAIIGYFIGRKTINTETNSEESKKRIAKLEADLEACKVKLSSKGITAASTSSSISSSFASGSTKESSKTKKAVKPKATTKTNTTSKKVAVSSGFNTDAAKKAFGKKIKENDLKIVEGIGPKIEQLFHNHDVNTWKALSECSLEKCQKVLISGGDRYKMHKPGTWPKQAELAYQGKWDELVKWQDELDGGK